MLDARHDYEDVSKLTKAEMARFDKEKVDDFKKALEEYSESLAVRQREVSSDSLFVRRSTKRSSPVVTVSGCIELATLHRSARQSHRIEQQQHRLSRCNQFVIVKTPVSSSSQCILVVLSRPFLTLTRSSLLTRFYVDCTSWSRHPQGFSISQL